MAIPFVQANSFAEAGHGTGTQTCAFVSPVTKSNLLLVSVNTFDFTQTDTAITTAISDTLSNSYTQVGSYVDDGQSGRISLWYAASAGAGSDTISVTPSSDAYVTIAVLEYQLVNGFLHVDANHSSFSGSNTTAFTTGAIPAVNDGELIVACFGYSATLTSLPPPAGFNVRQQILTGTTQVGITIMDSLVQGAPVTCAATSGTSAHFTALGASFNLLPQAYAPQPRLRFPLGLPSLRMAFDVGPLYTSTPLPVTPGFSINQKVIAKSKVSFNPGVLASGRRCERPELI